MVLPRVRVKYLMWLRDKTGVDSEEYVLDKDATLENLITEISKKHPSLKPLLSDIFSGENPIIVLVNGVKGEPDRELSDNDEVALMPPVSGG